MWLYVVNIQMTSGSSINSRAGLVEKVPGGHSRERKIIYLRIYLFISPRIPVAQTDSPSHKAFYNNFNSTWGGKTFKENISFK